MIHAEKTPEIERRPTDIGVPNENHEIPLTRGLNLIQTTFLGVGTAIGGVMFAIMGRAVGAAGPSLVITFLIGSLFAFFDGISYAELGSAVPGGAGGAISFVQRAFGNTIPTFLTGWYDWMGSIADCAVGSVVFAYAIRYFLRWVEPVTIAVATLIFFAVINFKGVKATGKTEFILTSILVFTLCLFMVRSSSNFEIERFEPLFPNGFLPTLLMISYIYPTYAGYETITQLSEEVKTAGKTIPRALLLTLVIITILFTGTAAAMIGAAPAEVYVNSETPIQDAAKYFMGPIGEFLVSISGIIASLSTINGSMAGGTRITFALSRENLLPSIFKKVHPRYRSPYTALALTTLLAIVFVLTRSVDFIVYTNALGYIVTSIVVSLALLRLRKKEPQLYRPFKVPFCPYVPIIAIGMSAFMLIMLSVESLILGLVFGLVGILLLNLTRKIQKR